MKSLVGVCFVLLLSKSYCQENSCTLTGNSLDQLDTIKSTCKDIVIENFRVPAGKTLDLTSLSDATVTFKGNVSFDYAEWKGPLVLISGNNVNVSGTDGHVIDAQGERWWDGGGYEEGVMKPRFFKTRYLHNAIIKDLYLLNSPRHCFAIHNCTNITVSGIRMDAKDGDKLGGRNTDAFNVKGSENVFISDSSAYNQDDCLAVRSGNNVHFTRVFCSGGHGISVGSVGNRTNNDVQNVFVSDCEVVDSENGVRIKTVVNSTGSVTGISYNNITLSNITRFGIAIRGDYQFGGYGGTPSDIIPITDVNITNVRGTVLSTGMNVDVFVGEHVASKWYWENINITGGATTQPCSGLPEDSVGVFCS